MKDAPPAPPARRRRGFLRRAGSRAVTVGALLGHFTDRQRWFLLPLVIVLLLAGALLVATSGLSYVAPFVYTIF